MSNYPFPLPEPIHGVAYPKSLDELDALRVFHGKFLRPQMLGIHSQNPFAPWNSPSRSVMTTQHLPQRLIVEGLKSPRSSRAWNMSWPSTRSLNACRRTAR